MDAKITQIQVKNATFDEDGLKKKDAYASLTLNIPLDTQEQRDAITSLLELTSKEWVIAEVVERQTKLL